MRGLPWGSSVDVVDVVLFWGLGFWGLGFRVQGFNYGFWIGLAYGRLGNQGPRHRKSDKQS